MKVEMGNEQRVYANPEVSKVQPEKATRAEVKEALETASKREGLTDNEAKKVKDVVEKMNKELEMTDTAIKFKVHESKEGTLNKVSIKVVERESEKVIIEIPSEEAIEFSEKMDEITGMLFDHSR
ncbi:MAG: flagellar protein FlaG [Clostridia bacterium]|nr:flagellar protein FlaG [Clostridia bacterium]